MVRLKLKLWQVSMELSAFIQKQEKTQLSNTVKRTRGQFHNRGFTLSVNPNNC